VKTHFFTHSPGLKHAVIKLMTVREIIRHEGSRVRQTTLPILLEF
jgi:hypothetical protein